MTPRRVLWAGAAYALFYLLATTRLPQPDALQARRLLAILFLLPPTLLAFLATLRAARESSRAERAFWGLLAGGAFAQLANELLFGVFSLGPGLDVLRVAGHFAYDTYFTLVVVALLVRPDRPLGPGEARPVALDFTLALVCGYFLVFYFVLIPFGLRGYPWSFVYTVQEALPGVVALVLAWTVREGPFRAVYRLLAAGFGAAAIVALPGNWAYAHGGYHMYSPLDLEWMLPLFPLAAAALCPRGAAWVRPLGRDDGTPRLRAAALAVAAPCLLDLGMRAVGATPEMAETRSYAALVATATLAIVFAFRVRPRRGAARRSKESAAEVPASDFLSLAVGAAHEMNNPLMAVAGWAELAARRPGAPQARLAALLASVRRAADTVGKLQKLAHSAEDAQRSPNP